MAQDTRSSSQHEHHERKKCILNQGASSTTRDIFDAVVIKDGNIFFLAEQNGNAPLGDGYGMVSVTTIAVIWTATKCGSCAQACRRASTG